MKLTDKQTEFFSAMEGTFRTQGWTLLRQGWQEEQGLLSDRMFFNAKSMDDMNNARVRYGLLNELIELPATIAAQKAHFEEMDEPDDDENFVGV